MAGDGSEDNGVITPANGPSRTATGNVRSRPVSRSRSSNMPGSGKSVLERSATSSQLPVVAPARGEDEADRGHKAHKLGMFKGVLVPTCENMWGVIIFLRFYTIVGYAGLGLSLVIVTMSFSVALLTALALSAIATCGTSHNLSGVYPMLARALGKEIATATGLIYFLGITCLAVLECLGAVEELNALDTSLELTSFRFQDYDVRVWGSIFMVRAAPGIDGALARPPHVLTPRAEARGRRARASPCVHRRPAPTHPCRCPP